MVGEGFTATYSEDEANKLVEDSTAAACQVMEMIPIDMTQV
jgi:hypothetical protein